MNKNITEAKLNKTIIIYTTKMIISFSVTKKWMNIVYLEYLHFDSFDYGALLDFMADKYSLELLSLEWEFLSFAFLDYYEIEKFT